MNPLHAYLALTAAHEQRAVPKAACRHVHLHQVPFVIAGYHLAGDQGAPLALMWGEGTHASPQIVVVPEPRNRELRFARLGRFSTAFLDYLSRCGDAPQIIVPNTTTAQWLSGIVGRFTRNLRMDVDPRPPESVPITGKHLAFLGDQLPGSSLMIAATDVLSDHWQTGQLPAEDLNLGALLGWIDPPVGETAAIAARRGELEPPAGPISDPNWDAHTLTRLIDEWHEAEDDVSRQLVSAELAEELRQQLAPAWQNCCRAVELLDSLPEGEHVQPRWNRDCSFWQEHAQRVAAGQASFRNIPTPTQAATNLHVAEDATAAYEREKALDDRLIMAAYVAGGQALAGVVTSVDLDHTEIGATTRRRLRPLFSVAASIPFTRPVGTSLYLVDYPDVETEVVGIDDAGVVALKVVNGAISKKTISRIPAQGDKVVMSHFPPRQYFPRAKIPDVPWTHQEVPSDDI